MMAAYYLTPINTSSEKRKQLIREHIKGLVVTAIGSPLTKALKRSVETVGV